MFNDVLLQGVLTSELVRMLELFLRTYSFYFHFSQFSSFIAYVAI